MMIAKLSIILSLVFIHQFGYFESKEASIENCEAITTRDDEEVCTKCKDKHFLFFHDFYCFPCDHRLYGQIGCGGNCDGSKFLEENITYCNADECKKDFLYYNGNCFNCSSYIPFCKTCNVTENLDHWNNNKTYYTFKCEECSRGNLSIPYCESCEYYDYYYGYYLSSDKTCKMCKRDVNIGHGNCTICSDDENDLLSRRNCICEPDSYLNSNNTCTFCNEGCDYCGLNEENNAVKCFSCKSGTFISENECLICPEGCRTCGFDSENQTECYNCLEGYTMQNGKCIKCPPGCVCTNNYTSNELYCLYCDYKYALDSENNCNYCANITGLEGCENCEFNSSTNKYECLSCEHKEFSGFDYDYDYYYYDISEFTYIRNEKKCIKNTEPKWNYLYGCREANYSNNIYECLNCKSGYTFIPNDKTCRKLKDLNLSNYCSEIINLGTVTKPKYSCNKCYTNAVKIVNSTNISDCFYIKDMLPYCLEGKLDKNNDYQCTKCVSNATLTKDNTCECDSSFFGYRNSTCLKCSNEMYDDGCDFSKGCWANYSYYYYYHYDYEYYYRLNCNQCKSGYYLSDGRCYACNNRLDYCQKCNQDANYTFTCEKCVDNFSYNLKRRKCELNCEENLEISPGCMMCDEKHKNEKKCNLCKPNYFKTKDEQCLFCKSEKYGGPACLNCQYEKDNNGKETSNIVCSKCDAEYDILNSKGKCYNCKANLFDECEKCNFTNYGKSNEKLVCLLCKPGYYLDSEGNCVNYMKYIKQVPNCEYLTYTIGNITFKVYYDDNDDPVHSYESYNDYYYYYYHYKGFSDFVRENVKEINSTIKGECRRCKDGYYMKNNKACIKLTIEQCKLDSMVKDKLIYECLDFCEEKGLPFVVMVNETKNGKDYKPLTQLMWYILYHFLSH